MGFSKIFLQFSEMDNLRFLTFPDQAKFEELGLSCIYWLDLENLEMELMEFQENPIWKNAFYNLRETLSKIEEITNFSKLSSENKFFFKFGILCPIIVIK